MNKKELKNLNKVVKQACRNFKPPENLTVSEWADKYRRLSPETSAEAGPWRTRRTPYLKEPMDCFTDPKVHKIVMVAASQVGKTEFEINAIGYIIDQDPGVIIFGQPTIEEARKFSDLRIKPLMRDTSPISRKLRDVAGSDASKTKLQKSFPGGMLFIVGSNSPAALASTPARYIIGDERDRWAMSAGNEGDPWKLAERRQTTFYNRKSIEVSTPTIKGASNIEYSYQQGTQELWCHKCPECGEYHEITFERVHWKHSASMVNGKRVYKITEEPTYCCPNCGCMIPETKMRKQPAKWIATNPDAYEKGCRSFWLTAFSSPWTSWSTIIMEFLESKNDPSKLQVVYNTLLGKLWEERGDLIEEDEILARRENYGKRDDGTEIELPDGVLVLTCGVDTQDDRLEYEVVGYGMNGESWGIKKGMIMGVPDTEEPWQRLDDVIEHLYLFQNGKGLRISCTFIDSGGHYTQEVYKQCKKRFHKKVFAIKGKGGDGVPFVAPPSKIEIGRTKSKSKKMKAKNTVWLYTIGVDAGKTKIMNDIKIQEAGPKFMHFPRDEERGYDERYFSGLLSERMVLSKTKSANRWTWKKIPGHERNEPLDIRNYANAALRAIDPDMARVAERIKGLEMKEKKKTVAKEIKSQRHIATPKLKKKKQRSMIDQSAYNDW